VNPADGAIASERAPATRSLHLAWQAEHVGALLSTGRPAETILPLTTAAWRALAERAPRPPAALALIDLKRDWRKLESGALAVADEAMAHLAPRRTQGDIVVREPALDRWRAYLWARQILHLQDVLTFVRAECGPEARLHLPETPEPAGHSARMRWFLELALAGAGIDPPADLFAPARLALPGTPPIVRGRPGILVATFGLPDLPGTIMRLARRPEALLLFAESENAHIEYLAAHWQDIAARPGGAALITASESDVLPDVEPAPLTIAQAIAEALATRAWPIRRSVWQHVERIFAAHPVIEAHIGDHACDGGAAILAQTRKNNTALTIESHSGLPMPAIFHLPLSAEDRGRYAVWHRSRALDLKQELASRNVPLSPLVARPRSFGPPAISLAGTLWRHVRTPKRPLRLGMLITTGLDGFAADRALEPILSDFADFIEQSIPLATQFEVRLRMSEDDPRLFTDRLTRIAAASVSFHRVGERSLRAMLSDLDAVIELGSPTSASLTALARGVPVFRLAAHAYQATLAPGPALPVLPRTGAVAALQARIGSPFLRTVEGLRQHMLLIRRKRTGKSETE
jgi:hypothetical protein